MAIRPFPCSIIALSAPLILVLIACNFALILLAALSEVENRVFAASCFFPTDKINWDSSAAPQAFFPEGLAKGLGVSLTTGLVLTWVDRGRPIPTIAAAVLRGVATVVRTGLIWAIILAWTGRIAVWAKVARRIKHRVSYSRVDWLVLFAGMGWKNVWVIYNPITVMFDGNVLQIRD